MCPMEGKSSLKGLVRADSHLISHQTFYRRGCAGDELRHQQGMGHVLG